MEQSSPIAEVFQGGGIIFMMKTGLIVFFSSAFTGIFEGTDLLNGVKKELVKKKKSRQGIFAQTIFISFASAIIGCTQTLAVMLTHILIKEAYGKNKLSNEEIAIDLENSAIMIAPMIPWNVAALVPLTTMGVGPKALLFSFYLFLLPSTYLISLRRKGRYIMDSKIKMQ